jgi:hypothetical protein
MLHYSIVGKELLASRKLPRGTAVRYLQLSQRVSENERCKVKLRMLSLAAYKPKVSDEVTKVRSWVNIYKTVTQSSAQTA